MVVCLPGARIEHVTESVDQIMGRGNTGTHRDEQRKQGRNDSDCGEVQEPTEEDEASKGWTDTLIRNYTSVWKQDPRIQEFEEDDSQMDGGAAFQGRVSLIHGFVGQLCGKEEMYARDGLHLSGMGAAVFAEVLSGAVASGLGKVGQGGLSKKFQNVQEDSRCMGIQRKTS